MFRERMMYIVLAFAGLFGMIWIASLAGYISWINPEDAIWLSMIVASGGFAVWAAGRAIAWEPTDIEDDEDDPRLRS